MAGTGLTSGSTRTRTSRSLDHLSILSANVRSLKTNLGDLTHSFVLPLKPDIIATTETWLNPTHADNFGKIRGYTKWHRKDRTVRQLGGIAVCFKNSIQAQPLEVDMPTHLELSFFRLWTKSHEAILLCVCYRPQWHGSEPLTFLQDNLDRLLLQFSCKNVIIVGDLNQYLVQTAFDDLLDSHGLTNHVDFPTHISGSSLDPVITDLPEGEVKCRPEGKVGSSDHFAVYTSLNIKATREKEATRTTWQWDRGDWNGLRAALDRIDWDNTLVGDVDDQAQSLTQLLVSLQSEFVPHKDFNTKPSDQPWFGPNCREAADDKARAWKCFKRNPTRRNKRLYKAACTRMKRTQKWAIKRWKEDLRTKLSGRSVGGKSWWSCIKQHQGQAPDDCIPPLDKPDGSVAASNMEKAELLASFFSNKMRVPDPDRPPPKLPPMTHSKLKGLTVTTREVRKQLKDLDVTKAVGPDKISPHTLSRCADQLAAPLAALFQACLVQNKWPKIWKRANVVAIHKKNRRTSPQNYRPISLLSIVAKVYERILVKNITNFFDTHHLISNRQFGFRSKRSVSDLLLQLTSTWQKSLDKGTDTCVIALDIAGAFDRVWHKGITAKLESLGITGDLLQLLQDYLQGRTLQVVVNGRTSSEYPIEASVPQGSVLGPLLWNVYLNDILQLIPQAHAYADDCTLSFTLDNQNREDTAQHITSTLGLITAWSNKWQVTFAPEKTQAMLITRRQEQNVYKPDLLMDGNKLSYSCIINILGVQIDSCLKFTHHVKEIAKKAARKLACIRRIAPLLDGKGCYTLYNSQVRSLMEYCPLVWSSCPPSYLELLDKVQDRATRLVALKSNENDRQLCFQPLQHRREVAALCVLYKIHRQNIPHLAALRLEYGLEPGTVAMNNTRNSSTRGQELQVPFGRTEQYLRSFQPKYANIWNEMVQHTTLHLLPTLQAFKSAVHRWRLQHDPG